MKGQITRHEWEGPFSINSPDTGYIFCRRCTCKKKFEYAEWSYMPVDKSDWQVKEPDCITRKKTEDGVR